MNPFFFGATKRQLFGMYDPARVRSSRGAVVCYPWGREYLLAHPTLKLLSQRLAEGGWHALRFDYLGTGDSAGDAADASRQQWIADVDTAVDELRDMAQVKEVALVGMRHGGTLAALAAAQRRDISRLVLWDPVADGREYLAELRVPANANGRELDVGGAVLTDRLRRDLEAITPSIFGPTLPRTLVVSTAPEIKSVGSLVTRLQSAGVDCVTDQIADVQVWREEWDRGGKGLAVAAVNRIVSWLT